MTPETIRRDVAALREAQQRLRTRPRREILAALDEVVQRWLAPDSGWMRAAETAIAAETGFAPAMLHEGLPRMLAPLRAPAIERLLEEECGAVNDRAPELVVHVLPGNVPALAATSICLTLALGAAALVKPGREEQSFAPRFAASLAEVDADLGACVAVRYWPGGEREIEDEIFAAADAVDFAGGDEALADVAPRVPGRFVGRGARLSFAAIGREILDDRDALEGAAVAIADDASIWEQRGCLSPQVVLVETASAAAVESAAGAVAAAMDDYARRWSPPVASLDEKAAALRFRTAVEWGLGDETGARVVSGAGGGWTLVLERTAALRPTCLQRTLRLQPLADFAALPSLILPLRARIESAGLAVATDRYDRVAAELLEAGVPRVCRAGEQQHPDLTWKPGGLPRVAGWLHQGEEGKA